MSNRTMFRRGILHAKFLITLFVISLISSCGDDDEPIGPISPDPVTGEGNIRIVEVDAASDEVTLQNFGDAPVDLTNYWFCLRRTYTQASQLTITSGEITIAEDGQVTFSIPVNDEASDVSIYNTGGSFASATALVDFMQFNGSFTSNGREDVAVTKGIWAAGAFVEGATVFTYNGDGNQTGASQWSGDEDPVVVLESTVKIVKVDPANDLVTLKNIGTTAEDISAYYFCIRKTYPALSSLTPVSGDLTLDADEEIQFTVTVDDTSSDVGLYFNNSGFASADNMIDFMQFGEDIGADGRVNVATEAGIWTSGTFIPGIAPFSFLGGASDAGANFWIDNANIRIISITPETDEVVIKNFDTQARDISGYFFCTQQGVYPSFSSNTEVEIVTGDFELDPNEEVTVRVLATGGVVDDEGAIHFFSTNQLGFNTANPYVLRDFAQWGAGNGLRSDNAVAAGRWDDAANFISGESPYDFSGGATDIGSTFWNAAATIRVIAINPDTESVTIKNFGGTDIDISAYEFCLGPGNYNTLSNYTNLTGDLMLSANEEVIIDLTSSTEDVDALPDQGGLGLFVDGSAFASTSPDQLKDYVQWGAANQPRVDQAVTAGRWDDAANFVSGTAPFSYTGDFNDVGSTFWEQNEE